MKTNELSIYDEDYLKSKIYIIRGVQVMIDADLADIYGYSTKRFNEQVKNNIERFDEDMRFQLTSNEYDVLRSKISTSKPETRGGRQYLPYVFTEQGIYMLMTVLKGELAVDQSKKLIRLFKQMKDFIVQFDLTVVVKDFTDSNIKKDYLLFNGQEESITTDIFSLIMAPKKR